MTLENEDLLLSNVKCGDRFECDGQYGTIRYIGAVSNTKGLWLGVEWDDPKRGKHDGQLEGRQYFKTSHPTTGSFIRAKKVNFGISFCIALNHRYGEVKGEDGGIEQDEMFVVGDNKVTTVQVIGAKKVNLQQSQSQKLNNVVLRETFISRAGDKADFLSANLVNLTELDLTQNLLSDWARVASITENLPALQMVNLSDNRLEITNMDALSPAFKKVSVLFLNRMNYNWAQICECVKAFPSLKDLHICFNAISTITSPEKSSVINQLELLNLEGNLVNSWQEILSLSHLNRIVTLILNNTGIKEILFPEDLTTHGKTSVFRGLVNLSLSNNKISDWSSINELNKLGSFSDLKFQNNPINESINEKSFRHILIAKIANLRVFNKSMITSEERKGAEIDYLKMFGKEWISGGGHQNSENSKPALKFSLEHPRYQELVEKHGPAEDSELKQHSNALKDNIINLRIECEGKTTLTKKVPLVMTVQKLKILLQRLLKVDSTKMHLSYISQKMSGPSIIFDNDFKEIGFYSVEDGDTVVVKCL